MTLEAARWSAEVRIMSDRSAVVQIAGKQMRVHENDVIKVPLLADEVGSSVEFDQVLFVSDDDVKIAKKAAEGRRHAGTQGCREGKGHANAGPTCPLSETQCHLLDFCLLHHPGRNLSISGHHVSCCCTRYLRGAPRTRCATCAHRMSALSRP